MTIFGHSEIFTAEFDNFQHGLIAQVETSKQFNLEPYHTSISFNTQNAFDATSVMVTLKKTNQEQIDFLISCPGYVKSSSGISVKFI